MSRTGEAFLFISINLFITFVYDTFHILSSIKNADDSDSRFFGICKVVNNIVVDDQFSHFHTMPRLPVSLGMTVGERTQAFDSLSDTVCLV